MNKIIVFMILGLLVIFSLAILNFLYPSNVFSVLIVLLCVLLAIPIIYRYGKKGPAVINKVAEETVAKELKK